MVSKDETSIRPGQTIGSWTVIARESRAGRTFWLCSCACGVSRSVAAPSLKRGDSTSCGCQRIKHRSGTIVRHGHSSDPIYKVWSAMHQRCENPNSPVWHVYGGRGITVDPRWDDFLTFAADMGPRPKGHSIDRVDNDGPYSPENCRWATRQEQNSNLSRNVWLTYKGETRTVSGWAALTGIHVTTLRKRLTRLSVDDALTRPVKHRR